MIPFHRTKKINLRRKFSSRRRVVCLCRILTNIKLNNAVSPFTRFGFAPTGKCVFQHAVRINRSESYNGSVSLITKPFVIPRSSKTAKSFLIPFFRKIRVAFLLYLNAFIVRAYCFTLIPRNI